MRGPTNGHATPGHGEYSGEGWRAFDEAGEERIDDTRADYEGRKKLNY